MHICWVCYGHFHIQFGCLDIACAYVIRRTYDYTEICTSCYICHKSELPIHSLHSLKSMAPWQRHKSTRVQKSFQWKPKRKDLHFDKSKKQGGGKDKATGDS